MVLGPNRPTRRRFIPITPAKGKKRIRRSSGYRVAGACPQVGPLPFKASPALPICTREQDAPLPYRIVCMAGHPRCLLPNLLRSLFGATSGPGGVWAGVVFSDRSGVSSDPGLWLRGLVRFVSGFKSGLRVRLCHERFAGSTGSNGGARSSGALSSAAAARSFGPGGKINARTAMFLRTG